MDKDTHKDNRRLRAFVKRFVNPMLRYAARAGVGPFALLRHVGRRSGKPYENPIWVWRMKDGFMIVLTYGRNVDWLRNLQAAEQRVRHCLQVNVGDQPLFPRRLQQPHDEREAALGDGREKQRAELRKARRLGDHHPH